MSEIKHTPGPWLMHDNGRYYDIGVPCDMAVMPVYPTVCIGVTHENAANARLIAAAPELLEALELLVSSDEIHGQLCDGERAVADAAIAKARGGA